MNLNFKDILRKWNSQKRKKKQASSTESCCTIRKDIPQFWYEGIFSLYWTIQFYKSTNYVTIEETFKRHIFCHSKFVFFFKRSFTAVPCWLLFSGNSSKISVITSLFNLRDIIWLLELHPYWITEWYIVWSTSIFSLINWGKGSSLFSIVGICAAKSTRGCKVCK